MIAITRARAPESVQIASANVEVLLPAMPLLDPNALPGIGEKLDKTKES